VSDGASGDGRLVIDLRDVSVRYRLPRERIPTFKEFAIKWLRGSVVYDDLLALAHVDLRVRAGESVGIIGRRRRRRPGWRARCRGRCRRP